MDDLKIKTVRNIGFNAFSNVAKFILAAGASIILAQKLSSSDYGVVGFAISPEGYCEGGWNYGTGRTSDRDRPDRGRFH
ncbi:MAG: hypothetical protein PHH96_08435 [Smithellaceae bacterium]|nr:hypothetical protein [Smithellaceae bacterium]